MKTETIMKRKETDIHASVCEIMSSRTNQNSSLLLCRPAWSVLFCLSVKFLLLLLALCFRHPSCISHITSEFRWRKESSSWANKKLFVRKSYEEIASRILDSAPAPVSRDSQYVYGLFGSPGTGKTFFVYYLLDRLFRKKPNCLLIWTSALAQLCLFHNILGFSHPLTISKQVKFIMWLMVILTIAHFQWRQISVCVDSFPFLQLLLFFLWFGAMLWRVNPVSPLY